MQKGWWRGNSVGIGSGNPGGVGVGRICWGRGVRGGYPGGIGWRGGWDGRDRYCVRIVRILGLDWRRVTRGCYRRRWCIGLGRILGLFFGRQSSDGWIEEVDRVWSIGRASVEGLLNKWWRSLNGSPLVVPTCTVRGGFFFRRCSPNFD